MTDKIILWTLILALFVTSLWAVNERNKLVAEGYYWHDEWSRYYIHYLESSRIYSDFMFALFCELYPTADRVSVIMGKWESENTSGQKIAFHSQRGDEHRCRFTEDIEITVK